MIPEQILTHETDGLRRLMQQYKGQEKITGILRVYLRRWQAMEDLSYSFFDLLDIESATGHQLDLIGNLVGESRTTLDDGRYRKLIYLRIFRQRKIGTIPNVTRLYKLLIGATLVRYRLIPPAGLTLEANQSDGLLSGSEIRSIMLTMIPAGVSLELTLATGEPFVTEGGDGLGFDDNDAPGGGGEFAGVVE